MISDVMTQRRHQRSPHKETLEITVPSHPKNGTLIAISSNICDGGLCIYTFKPLAEGEEILFKSALPVPYQRAEVRWVRQCNPTIYKAGVQFFT